MGRDKDKFPPRTEELGGDPEPCRSLARTATKKMENSVGSGGFEGPVGHSCQESK